MNVKQYIAMLKAFFNDHAQINTVLSGNAFNFNAESKVTYPVSHIEYISELTSGQVKRYSFLVTLGDLFDPNLPDSEEDIYSDCGEIADDFFSYFANQYEVDYTVLPQSANIQKWTNGNVDRVCGNNFIAVFQEENLKDICNIPLKSKINVPTIDHDAQLLIDAAGLDSNTGEAWNRAVLKLKSRTAWGKLDYIHPFLGSTADQHKWNGKHVADTDAAYRATFVNVIHGTNYVQYVDFGGDATNTHWDCSKYGVFNRSFGVQFKELYPENNGYAWQGTQDLLHSGNIFGFQTELNTVSADGLNQFSYDTVGVPIVDGDIVTASINNSSDGNVYINKTSVVQSNSVGNQPEDGEMWYGTTSDFYNTYSNAVRFKQTAGFGGRGLSQIDIDDIVDALQQLSIDLNR